MKETIALVVFILIVGLVAGCKVTIWKECRASHSFLYCMYRK